MFHSVIMEASLFDQYNINVDTGEISFEKGKVFVGGLSWKTTTSSFEKYFTQFGEMSSCCIMINWKTGKPRGFGFVTFESEAVVRELLSVRHAIDGKEVELKRCTPKVLNRLIRKQNEATDSRKVFLGGIPQDATENHLLSAFEQHFGPVEHVIIICQPDYCFRDGKPRSRGFGFVTFGTEAVAQRAIHHKQIFLLGKQVEIKPAEPKNPCEQLLPTKPPYAVATASETYPTTWSPEVSPTSLPEQPIRRLHSPQSATLSPPPLQTAPHYANQYIPQANPTALAMVGQRYPLWFQQPLVLPQQYGYMPQGLLTYTAQSSPMF